MFNFLKAELGGGNRACFCETLGNLLGVGKFFVFAVRKLCCAEGPKEELCRRAFVWCPGGVHSLSNTEATGQGSFVLPDPQEPPLCSWSRGCSGLCLSCCFCSSQVVFSHPCLKVFVLSFLLSSGIPVDVPFPPS